MGKDLELRHLETFKSIWPQFPPGNIVCSERPDFLVTAQDNNVIGIEHTELLQPGHPGGTSLQARDSFAERVVDDARTQYAQDGAPDLQVQVYFTSAWQKPADPRRLALALCRAVELLALIPGQRASINAEDGAGLPAPIGRLEVYRPLDPTESFWICQYYGLVVELGAEDISARIQAKNEKVAEYRKQCTQLWLLMVSDQDWLSKSVSLSGDAKAHVYFCDFDRVFVLWSRSREYIELKVSHGTNPSVNQSNAT